MSATIRNTEGTSGTNIWLRCFQVAPWCLNITRHIHSRSFCDIPTKAKLSYLAPISSQHMHLVCGTSRHYQYIYARAHPFVTLIGTSLCDIFSFPTQWHWQIDKTPARCIWVQSSYITEHISGCSQIISVTGPNKRHNQTEWSQCWFQGTRKRLQHNEHISIQELKTKQSKSHSA